MKIEKQESLPEGQPGSPEEGRTSQTPPDPQEEVKKSEENPNEGEPRKSGSYRRSLNYKFLNEMEKGIEAPEDEARKPETSPRDTSGIDLDFLVDDDEEPTLQTSEKRKTILEEIKEKEEIAKLEEPEVLEDESPKEKTEEEQVQENPDFESAEIRAPEETKNETQNSDRLVEEVGQKEEEPVPAETLKEENIQGPSKEEEDEESRFNKEIKEYFPTDNDSVDTMTQSKNLTSRFETKKKKRKPRRRKKVSPKIGPLEYREQNFNISGMIHIKMKEYNSLTDHSLKKFFCSPEKVRHMTKVGLITKKGLIIKNPEIYLKMRREEKHYSNPGLPKISKFDTKMSNSKIQRSTLSGKEVSKAIKAKSLKAKKKLVNGLSPLGRVMLKENRTKQRQVKKQVKHPKVTKKKFDKYLRQVENLYNIK